MTLEAETNLLPEFWPAVEMLEGPADDFPGFKPQPWSQAAQFPPVQKLNDGRLVVDWWAGSGVFGIKAWTRADHPNLSLIPNGAPRVVRALYRADVQFAMLRGDYGPVMRAVDAWNDWHANMREQNQKRDWISRNIVWC